MIRVLNRLLYSGSRSDSKSSEQDSTRNLVFKAARQGQVSAVMIYRQQGIQLAELEDRNKSNLLHIAAREGQVELLGLLVTLPEFLGMINHTDRTKRTPLHVAAAIGHDEVVQVLLRCGADKNCMDDSCWTPLHWGVYGDHGSVCEALLLAHADPHRKAGSQPSALALLDVNDWDSDAREVFNTLVLSKNGAKGSANASSDAKSDEESVIISSRGAWVAFRANAGQTYYWNRRDNTTTWKLPMAAKVAWFAFQAEDGGTYYWHAKSKTTTWQLPLMHQDDLESDDGGSVVGDDELAGTDATAAPAVPAPALEDRPANTTATPPPGISQPPPSQAAAGGSPSAVDSRRRSNGQEAQPQPSSPLDRPTVAGSGYGTPGEPTPPPTSPPPARPFRRGTSGTSTGSTAHTRNSPSTDRKQPANGATHKIEVTPAPKTEPVLNGGNDDAKRLSNASTDLIMKDADLLLAEANKKHTSEAASLQADISRAILAEDELGLQASVEVARGILESNSLEEALQALQEVKRQKSEVKQHTHYKHSMQVQLAEAMQRGDAASIRASLEEAKAAGCSSIIIARAEDQLHHAEQATA
mmetsp:Transcript_74029/g.176219  ORF Transcript_74029/g.176219 Transcript_74029/m.176219 type:complete len:584 (+) Transcript_74029:101-1852(+)